MTEGVVLECHCCFPVLNPVFHWHHLTCNTEKRLFYDHPQNQIGLFRSALQNAGKRSYISVTASSGPRSPCLTQNIVRLRWPRFPTTMLFLANISISGLMKPRSENIVQILVATFTLLALLQHLFYFHSILRDRLNLRIADPQVDAVPFSILSISCSQFKNFSAAAYWNYRVCKKCCPLSDIHFAVVCQG